MAIECTKIQRSTVVIKEGSGRLCLESQERLHFVEKVFQSWAGKGAHTAKERLACARTQRR